MKPTRLRLEVGVLILILLILVAGCKPKEEPDKGQEQGAADEPCAGMQPCPQGQVRSQETCACVKSPGSGI